MPIVHAVARCRPGRLPLFDFECARWLWWHLRRSFPEVLAAVLMPNHLHLLLQTADPDALRRSLAAVLAAFSRRFQQGELWEPVPRPEVVAGPDKLLRQLRYIHLNPCRPWAGRPGLVQDPLCWPWSTHRDLLGAVVDPWVKLLQLEAVLGRRYSPESLHAYVSSDPSVAVQGTPPPRSAPPSVFPVVPLDRVVQAAAVATRSPVDPGEWGPGPRAVLVGLARHQGWRSTGQLALCCAASEATVRRLSAKVDPVALEAAALCLGDERLRAEASGRK